VAHSTLTDRAKGRHISLKEASKKKQILAPEAEKALLDWAVQSGETGLPYSKLSLRSHASALRGSIVGKRFHEKFEARHPILKKAKGSKLDPKRAKHFNKAVVDDFFDKWEELNTTHSGIPPEHIWNMDEKGIQMGGGRKGNGRKFYFSREQAECFRISSDNLELVTVLECVSAAGESTRPSFVLKEGILPDLRDLDHELIYRTESGWTDNHHAAEWIEEVFLP
ncbi:hypothetical protein M413DRAFT_39802, partial [Hebeloma cylindrosporum]